MGGRYNVTLCSYFLMAGEKGEEWRGRYNVILCSYFLWQENRERSGGEDIM